jgi:hypothetical protein
MSHRMRVDHGPKEDLLDQGLELLVLI